MAAAGWNAAYGDTAAPLDAVLTQEGLDTVHVVDEGCADYVAEQTADIPTGDLVKADPDTVPEWAKLLHDNDPGTFPSAADAPLLIIQGGNDEQIPVVSSALLFDQLCKVDQVEQRWIYPGQSHAGVIGPSLQDMLNWIGDRFADKPAPSVVPTGQSDVQAQTCPASAEAATTTTTAPTSGSTVPATAATATPVEATPTLTG
jgi:hypothetical protein